jgi:hypothetical protein
MWANPVEVQVLSTAPILISRVSRTLASFAVSLLLFSVLLRVEADEGCMADSGGGPFALRFARRPSQDGNTRIMVLQRSPPSKRASVTSTSTLRLSMVPKTAI